MSLVTIFSVQVACNTVSSRLPRNAPVWLDRLSAWLEPFEVCFTHLAQRGAFRLYLLALLSDSRRKSMSAMLERVADPGSYQAFQHFITHAPWNAERVWRELRARVPEREGMLILDGTSFPKLGPALGGRFAPILRHAGQGGQMPRGRDGGALDWLARVDIGRRVVRARSVADTRGAPAHADPGNAAVPGKVARGVDAGAPNPRRRLRITAVLGDAGFGDNATLRRTLHRLKLPYALGICRR